MEDTTRYLFMWGTDGDTIENPSIETIQHFLDRKTGVFTPLTEQGIEDYLTRFKNTLSSALNWYKGTKNEFNTYREEYPILHKADKGQLIDDIAVWHNVFSETLIKIMLFLSYSELGEKVRLKMVSDTIARYNLDLVIKDFKPDYVIPTRDRGVLVTGLKEIEKYDAKIYQRLSMAVGLEVGALHNEVIDAYERVIQTIHPTQQIDGNTLAGELPVNAGGTQGSK